MGYSMADLQRWLQGNPDLSVVVGDGLELPITNTVALARYAVLKTTEHDLQVALIAECDRRALHNPLWGMIFAIPNGGYRSKKVAGELKAEGVRAGVLDLFLPMARREYHGLFLELKVDDNKPSKEQLRFIERVRGQGFYATVVWDDLAKCLDILDWYLEGK